MKSTPNHNVVLSTNREYLQEHVFINTATPAPNMRRMSHIDNHRSDVQRYLPWFWPDDELAETFRIRKETYSANPNQIFQPGKVGYGAIRAACQHLLQLQAAYLTDHFPDTYSIEEKRIINKLTDERYDLDTTDEHPLAASGLLGQEDICIVEQQEDNRHIIAAGFVASPTDWNLPDFVGRDMDATHARVGDYDKRLKAVIDRSLLRLPEFPERQFARNNIFLEQNPALAIFPDSKPEFDAQAIAKPEDEIFLRSERETLTRLPGEHRRFIVFTIKPHVYRLSDVKEIRGEELASAIRTNAKLRSNEALASAALTYLEDC